MHRLLRDPEHFQALMLRWFFAIAALVEAFRILFLHKF